MDLDYGSHPVVRSFGPLDFPGQLFDLLFQLRLLVLELKLQIRILIILMLKVKHEKIRAPAQSIWKFIKQICD